MFDVTSKTPRANPLGVFVCLLGWFWIGSVWADCPPADIDETAQLAYVLDGDTLQLRDGRRVRVLGLNTPEKKTADQVGEPLADAARKAAKDFFQTKNIYLQFDAQRKDRYGRWLAHVYNQDRQSMGAMLLAKGLAFQVVVPPNISGLECLGSQERLARKRNLGVWRESHWRLRSASELRLHDTGFMRVKGKVQNVTVNKDIWLELEGSLVIRIAGRDKRYFGAVKWEKWRGKTIHVRGWITDKSAAARVKKDFKPLVMQGRHPSMFEKMP